MKGMKLFTANRIPLALSNLTYNGRFTVTDLLAAAEDSANGAQLLKRLRAIGMREQMCVARETDHYTRIRIIDCFGNTNYLEAQKG